MPTQSKLVRKVSTIVSPRCAYCSRSINSADKDKIFCKDNCATQWAYSMTKELVWSTCVACQVYIPNVIAGMVFRQYYCTDCFKAIMNGDDN